MKPFIVLKIIFFGLFCSGYTFAQVTKIEGRTGDIIIIGNYNTINVTQVIGTSQEYHKLKNRLGHLDSTIAIKTRNCSDMERDHQLQKQRDRCRRDLDAFIAERAEVQKLEQVFRDEVMRLAETFSNTELNSERLRQAMSLFEGGKIQEAGAVLSTKEMLQEGQQRLAQHQKNDSLLRISAYEFMLKAQITLANDKHPFRYDSADWFFRQSLRFKEDCQNLTAYADFFQFYKKSYDEAIHYYNRGLAYNDLAEGTAHCAICCTTSTPHHLGMAYEAKGDFVHAGEAYSKGLESMRRWVQTDTMVYEALANNLSRLIFFYKKQKDYARIEATYNELLEIYRRLAQADSTIFERPATNEQRITKTRIALANLYGEQKDYGRAEAAYLELLKANPKTDTQLEIREKLAALYQEQKDYARAEIIYRELLESNPTFGKQLKIQEKLILLYREQVGTAQPEAVFLEMLKVYTPLAKTAPQAYEPVVAKIQKDLGELYSKQKDFARAELAYRKALDVYTSLAQATPKEYGPLEAHLQINLGRLYRSQQNYALAEAAYGDALETYLRLTQLDPQNYEPWVAIMRYELGTVCSLQNDFTRAEAAYGMGLSIGFHLPNTNPKKELVISLGKKNLKILYGLQKDFTRAEASLKDSLEINDQELRHFSDVFEKRRLRALLCLINLYEVWVESKPLPEKAAVQQKAPPLFETLSKNYPDNEFVRNGWPQSLGDLAWYHLFTRQYSLSEVAARAALKKSPGMTRIKIRLAHALLLQDKYSEAQKVYEELTQAAGTPDGTFGDLCLEDLNTLEHAGITHADFQKVRTLLKK